MNRSPAPSRISFSYCSVCGDRVPPAAPSSERRRCPRCHSLLGSAREPASDGDLPSLGQRLGAYRLGPGFGRRSRWEDPLLHVAGAGLLLTIGLVVGIGLNLWQMEPDSVTESVSTAQIVATDEAAESQVVERRTEVERPLYYGDVVFGRFHRAECPTAEDCQLPFDSAMAAERSGFDPADCASDE